MNEIVQHAPAVGEVLASGPMWLCVAGIAVFSFFYGMPLVFGSWGRYDGGTNNGMGGNLPDGPGTPVAITLRPLGFTFLLIGIPAIFIGVAIGQPLVIGGGIIALLMVLPTRWAEDRETSHRLAEDGIIPVKAAPGWGCTGLILLGIATGVVGLIVAWVAGAQ